MRVYRRLFLFCIICANISSSWGFCSSSNNNITGSYDEYALTSIYHNMDGQYWYNNENWLNFNISYCDWYGITCNDDCTIYSIILYNNNVSGYIPLLPPSSLLRTEQIIMSYNKIRGGVNNLSTLINLTLIELDHNILEEELTYDLINMPSLTDIFLFSNLIYGQLPDFSYNSNIASINLRDNKLTGTVPSSILNVKNLGVLDLSYNYELSGTFPDVLEYAPLWYLGLMNCNFTGPLPQSIGTSTIIELYLSGNNFSGSIPASYQNLIRLNGIDLSKNQLEDGLENIIYLPRIKAIDVSTNKFNQMIPDFLFSESCFVEVFMGFDNDFYGDIKITSGEYIWRFINLLGNPRIKLTLEHAHLFVTQTKTRFYYPNGCICSPIYYSRALIYCEPEAYDYVYCTCRP